MREDQISYFVEHEEFQDLGIAPGLLDDYNHYISITDRNFWVLEGYKTFGAALQNMCATAGYLIEM